MNILVVDDNKNMRHLLKTLLHAYGVVNIFEAEEGDEAYHKLCEHGVDLVLCDLVMEPVDGFQFVERVRKGEDSPDPFVPIIIVSGYTERFRVAEARDFGVTEVLAKPVSAKELASRITSVVESPRPFIKTKDYFGPDRRRNKQSDLFYRGEERRMNQFSIEEHLNITEEYEEEDPLDDILDFGPDEGFDD